jgi:metal-responsive CopG/Arc/MetJ family transcriptional regulator
MVKPASTGTKSVSATLNSELADWLDDYSKENRLSRSQTIAHAIESFLRSKSTEARSHERRRVVNS